MLIELSPVAPVLKVLNAKQVMDRGGYEDADDTKDVKQEQKSAYDDFDPGAARSGQQEIGPGMSEEADLQRAIRKNPEAVEAYLRFGQYYRNKNLQHIEFSIGRP